MTTTPRLTLAHATLAVKQLDQTLAFYRDVLGFEIGWTWEGVRGGVFRGNVILFFVQQDAFEPRVTWISSTDVDATCAEWRERGATIVHEPEDQPHGLREFTMQDNNGHQFRVYIQLASQSEESKA